MILYHGTNTDITRIELSKCRPFKDFGRGFYLTSIERQAALMAKRTARISGGHPYVNVYEIADDFAQTAAISVLDFGSSPSQQWALFVMANRNPHKDPMRTDHGEKYDVVIGPVANDDIALLFAQYENGFIDFEALTKGLTYKHVTNQIAFRTQKAVALLKKTGIKENGNNKRKRDQFMSKQQMIEQFVIQDVVKLVSEDEGCDFIDAMRRFYTSKVFAVLEDFETLLYRESPRYVWTIYKEEVGHE